VEYQFHGANRLGANSLLSCLFAGEVSGLAATRYIAGLKDRETEVSPALLEEAKARFAGRLEALRARKGSENPYQMHQELGHWMTENVTVVRSNDRLRATLEHLDQMLQRYDQGISVPDQGHSYNQSLLFTKDLRSMLELARVITKGALLRDESRGAHYKPEFPERRDEWSKTTLARFTPQGPEITYEPVDMRYHQPVERNYR
jgi:succinate dehydrogenase / fumarate reductase flavoprotein subunit